MRPWLERLGPGRTLGRLNALADEAGLRTGSGRSLRFVPPGASDAYYEVRVFETGCVETRPESLHDLFNALAWLAFPRTKALINALHAEEIPRENGRRGRKRDLLTLLDEGGVIVSCNDASLLQLIQSFRWKTLFWEQRARVLKDMRFHVLGHATLEQALEPRPGISCKALFIGSNDAPDVAASAWLAALPEGATPALLPPLPIFGYPGWLKGSERGEFYDDARYFRPVRAVKSERESAGQPLRSRVEESPGSEERDAG